MLRILSLAAAVAAGSMLTGAPAAASDPCAKDTLIHHTLPARADTVHWGYFSKTLEPEIMVQSGDYVTVETATHHAGDDYVRMVEGDPGMESIYRWTSDGKGVERRGAGPMDAPNGAGGGQGVHILTGPIGVCGAEPGDVLEVRIVRMRPRPSGNPDYAGKAFGSNAAANWGYLYNHQIEEPAPREVITIYEVDAGGAVPYAEALYQYRWTPQTDPYGVTHEVIDYPGVVVDHDTVEEVSGTLDDVRVPLRLHFGTMGVAPREANFVNSIPPAYFGGNIDDWRIGEGATMYYPVAVARALLSMGDPHGAQGDSELAGTAVEMSLTGTVQVILHKQEELAGTGLEGLDFPLLETPSAYVVHGFTYANYLEALGAEAQSEIFGRSSVDSALMDAVEKMRWLLMNGKGLSEDEAISLMSVAVDFGVTQVVDGSWGMHGILPKAVFVD